MKYANPVAASLLFLASFALYIRTLAPSLLFGDSAEFQTIAYTLGIGHPTGYPVYTLFAKIFTFIPVNDIAYRVNLFSAFCAAMTVALVFLVIQKLGAGMIPAIFGALSLAVIPLFWKHASIAEIYTASAMFLAMILLAMLLWKETKNPRWLFMVGLFGGLSLGIHTTVALAAPAILIYIAISFIFPLSTHEERGKMKDLFQGIYGVFLGVVIFLVSFLLLDTANSPAGYYNTVVHPSLSVWDMTPADFDSPFERLAFLYFPPQFKGQLFNVPMEEVKSRLMDFADTASWNLWLGVIGIVSLLVHRKGKPSRWREAILFMIAFPTFLGFAVTYNVYDFPVYYIPAILILAVLVGLGVNAIVAVFALIPKLPRSVPVVLSVLILIVGLYPYKESVVTSWQERIPPGLDDWEGYFFEFPDARKLESEKFLKNVEDNAIVFTDWDYAYDFYYVAHILQGRVEMDFHETFPQEGVTQLADSTIEYIEANLDSRPIYFTERPSYLTKQYKVLPAGSGLYRIKRK